MRRIVQRAVVVAAWAVALGRGVLHAQGCAPGLIAGRVVDTAGAPVTGATVQATGAFSHAVRVTHTSDDGRYGFRFDAGDDRYDLLVRSPGMVPSRFVLVAGREPVLIGNVQMVPLTMVSPVVTARPVSSWFSGNQR